VFSGQKLIKEDSLMKHTTSRKKMLISSVAMLVVAMMALGSATYAWFSTNAKATASGIVAKTQQSSNLKVSEIATGDFAEAITFGTNTSATNTQLVSTTMNPVTTKNFSNWYTTTTDSVDKGIKVKDYDTATAGTDYSHAELYVLYDSASADATQAIDITVKTSKTSGTENFLRVALVPKTDDTTKTVFTDNVVYGDKADDFAKLDAGMTDLKATADSSTSLVTTTDTKMIANKTIKGTKVYGFDVYVWYEGNDPQCIDQNSTNNISVSFEVTKAQS
jgi:hypothetical protein